MPSPWPAHPPSKGGGDYLKNKPSGIPWAALGGEFAAVGQYVTTKLRVFHILKKMQKEPCKKNHPFRNKATKKLE